MEATLSPPRSDVIPLSLLMEFNHRVLYSDVESQVYARQIFSDLKRWLTLEDQRWMSYYWRAYINGDVIDWVNLKFACEELFNKYLGEVLGCLNSDYQVDWRSIPSLLPF